MKVILEIDGWKKTVDVNVTIESLKQGQPVKCLAPYYPNCKAYEEGESPAYNDNLDVWRFFYSGKTCRGLDVLKYEREL